VLFQRFWTTYREEVPQPYAEPWDEQRPLETPRGLADPVVALRHLASALEWTRQTYGRDTVSWGEANRFRAGDLDLPGDGADGQLGVYRVMRFDEQPVGPRLAGRRGESDGLAGFGDAWVLLVHFAQPVRAESVLAYGQTTRLSSPHSTDQLRMFGAHQLRPVWFSEQEIAGHVERQYRP
jgi:acyl-homoserine-lactone acylase